jgi:hypothetical protein
MIFEALIFWAATLEPGPRPSVIVHINTGDAVRIAQQIARDEGYDLDKETRDPRTGEKVVYWFDSLDGSPQGPLLEGYTSIGFYINTHIRSGISISNATGQALDMTSCELFDYPDLRPFQEQVMRLGGTTERKMPEELADEAGCESLRIVGSRAE